MILLAWTITVALKQTQPLSLPLSTKPSTRLCKLTPKVSRWDRTGGIILTVDILLWWLHLIVYLENQETCYLCEQMVKKPVGWAII